MDEIRGFESTPVQEQTPEAEALPTKADYVQVLEAIVYSVSVAEAALARCAKLQLREAYKDYPTGMLMESELPRLLSANKPIWVTSSSTTFSTDMYKPQVIADSELPRLAKQLIASTQNANPFFYLKDNTAPRKLWLGALEVSIKEVGPSTYTFTLKQKYSYE